MPSNVINTVERDNFTKVHQNTKFDENFHNVAQTSSNTDDLSFTQVLFTNNSGSNIVEHFRTDDGSEVIHLNTISSSSQFDLFI
jgi:hypothetical protein